MKKPVEPKILNQFLKLIPGTEAHLPLEEALDGLGAETASRRPTSMPYSIWQLLEHIRIAQEDILSFSADAEDYKALKWPDDYWPEKEAPDDQEALEKSIQEVLNGIEKMQDLVEDKNELLFEPIPGSKGQTLLREAVLLSQHNAYHIGQIVVLRRLLGDWK